MNQKRENIEIAYNPRFAIPPAFAPALPAGNLREFDNNLVGEAQISINGEKASTEDAAKVCKLFAEWHKACAQM